jgi:hypothetical protein
VRDAKAHPIVHVLPSFTDVAFLLPVGLLFAGRGGLGSLLGDGDTGWHIRAGEWMLAQGRVPTQDLFSFTRPDAPWYAWEWLWDVAFAAVHARWALAGVAFVSLAVIAVTFAVLYRMALGRSDRPLVAIAVTLLATWGSASHWLARPHLFTLLFTAVALAVLHQVKTGGRTRLLWLLPPLTLLWTNLHGGFLAGILCIAAYAGGELVQALATADAAERRAAARRALPYLWTLGASALASLGNPYTYHLHTHIYAYLNDPFTRQFVSEFQGPDFKQLSGSLLEVMLVLAACAAISYARRRQYAEVLLLAGWAHLALLMVRNVPIFMIVAAPLVAECLARWLRALAGAPVARWLRRAAKEAAGIDADVGVMERGWRLHLPSIAAMTILAIALADPQPGPSLRSEFDPAAYPRAALATLDRPDQRIFADDEWGDYLIYMLFPTGTRVFVDGRTDFYGAAFENAYVATLQARPGWSATLDRYGVDTLLLAPDAPLAAVAAQSGQWQRDYEDEVATVFRRVAPALD